MRKSPALIALLLALAFLPGCQEVPSTTADPAPFSQAEQEEMERMLDAQLGLLADQISPTERSRAMIFMSKLWPLRSSRLASGEYQPSPEESYLLDKLNQLYERYTVKYIGGGTWGYSDDSTRILASYQVQDQQLHRSGRFFGSTEVEPAHQELWDRMLAMLPQGSFDDFTDFIVFTDGVNNTLAYVTYMDDEGEDWAIAVDPADAEDTDWFIETVLHEYSHYLTLNADQVLYTEEQTVDTYNEPGMVCRAGSYLDDFYQRFWADILDDRLANMDCYHFYLRHADQFLTEYASTDPSEDIAECFSHFVFFDPPEGGVPLEKYNFFFAYPEMVSLREEIRSCLALE